MYIVQNNHIIKSDLKVVENKKNGGSRRRQMLVNGLGPIVVIYSLNMQFLIKNLIAFPACNSKIYGRLL